jgi:hypothetical protein
MPSLPYVVVVSLLFVPWAYGLYAMGRDAKNRWIPAFRKLWRARKRKRREKEREEEREDQRRQLY